jgi:hypothetical protein
MSVDRDIAIVSRVRFAVNTYADRISEPFDTSRASTNEKKKARIPVRNPISLTVNGEIAKKEDHDYHTRQLTERANLNPLLSLSRISGEMPESLFNKSPSQSQLCLDWPFHRFSMGRNISERDGFSRMIDSYVIGQRRRKKHSMQSVSQSPATIFIGRPIALFSIPSNRYEGSESVWSTMNSVTLRRTFHPGASGIGSHQDIIGQRDD